MRMYEGQIALLYGCGSEYVMAPLVTPLKEAGFDVVELDTLKNPKVQDVVYSIKKREKPVCFINSAPMLVDRMKFAIRHPELAERYYSALSIIRYLRPRKSVFMPHDLINPVVGREAFYLGQFDFYVSCDSYTDKHHCATKSINAGWIRHHKPLEKDDENKSSAVWFLSNFAKIFSDIESGIRLCEPILKQGISVKLPVWTNVEKVEETIINRGYNVIPAHADNFRTIHEHKVILVNGLSSVGWEAHLFGKPIIIMNVSRRDKLKYAKMLSHKGITLMDEYSDFDRSILEHLPSGEKQLKPFDFNLFIEALA